MLIRLDREDLLSLVLGSKPFFNVQNQVRVYGNFIYGDWKWNKHALERLTNEQLLEMYYICKNSWK